MKINKIKIFALSLFFLAFFSLAGSCQALNLQDAFSSDSGKPLDAAANKGAGFNTDVTFDEIAGAIIASVFSMLGVIFLALAIYGGYTWMTARGNEEMTEKAKKTLTNAIIGIIIVMASYAISYFVLSQISSKVLLPK